MPAETIKVGDRVMLPGPPDLIGQGLQRHKGIVTEVRWHLVNVQYDDESLGVASFHVNAVKLEGK